MKNTKQIRTNASRKGNLRTKLMILAIALVIGLFGMIMYQTFQNKLDVRNDKIRFSEAQKKNP